MKRFFTFIMSVLSVLLFTASAFAESPKTKIKKQFGEKLQRVYENPQNKDVSTGFCQAVYSKLDVTLPQKTALDFEFNKAQVELWNSMNNLLLSYFSAYATDEQGYQIQANVLAIYRIFAEACKERVGWYNTYGFQSKWVDKAGKERADEIRKEWDRESDEYYCQQFGDCK